jgi:phospholipase C
VFLFQENHAFDQYFGTFPGLKAKFALDTSGATCLPINLKNSSAGCVKPWDADNQSTTVQSSDLPHDNKASVMAYDNGKMNGFVASAIKFNATNYTYPMAYYTSATLPNYWDLASYFELDANFFSSVLSYSYPNHLYSVAAQSGPVGLNVEPASFNFTFSNIADELNAAHVSWKSYMAGWNDSLDCTGPYTANEVKNATTGWSGWWGVMPDFVSVQTTPSMCGNLRNTVDLLNDINAGTLPQVVWISPSPGNSEHAKSSGPAGLVNGQEYTATIIDAIEASSLWSSTAIFLTWDDFGGYYDNVPPVQLSDGSYFGFRVPLIVISPFTRAGQISYGTHKFGNGTAYGNKGEEDFTSFLSTVEYNWRLPALVPARDGSQPNLFFLLNFKQTPLKPLFLPTASLATYPWQGCVSSNVCTLAPSLGAGNPYLNFPPGVGSADSRSYANLSYYDID